MPRTELKPYLVRIGDFDPSKLCVSDVNVKNYPKGVVHSSQGSYLVNGEERELYLELPKSFSFGISENYPMNTPEDQQTPDKLVGLQTVYNLTGMENINKPTEDELYVMKVFSALEAKTWETVVREATRPKSERKIPLPSYQSYITAKEDNDPSSAVKPVFMHPNKDLGGEKVEDTSKPKRAYFKLVTYGKGRKMRCATPIHGPGNRDLNYSQLVGTKTKTVMGHILPIIKWEGVYWGQHGQTGRGASVTLKVSEMNFTPLTKRPVIKMISNDDPVEIDESDEEIDCDINLDDDDDDDVAFPSPIVKTEEPVVEEKEVPKKVSKPKAVSAKDRRAQRARREKKN